MSFPLGFQKSCTSAEPKAALKVRIKANRGRGSSLVTLAGKQSPSAEKQVWGWAPVALAVLYRILMSRFLGFPLPHRWPPPQLPGVIHCFPVGRLYTNQRLVKQVVQKPQVAHQTQQWGVTSPPFSPSSHWFVLSRVLLGAWLSYWDTLLNTVVVGKQESRQRYKSLKTSLPCFVSIQPSSYTRRSFLLFCSFLVPAGDPAQSTWTGVRFPHLDRLWQHTVSISQCPSPPASACVTLPCAWERPYSASYHMWMRWSFARMFLNDETDPSSKEPDSAKIITSTLHLIIVGKGNLSWDLLGGSHFLILHNQL